MGLTYNPLYIQYIMGLTFYSLYFFFTLGYIQSTKHKVKPITTPKHT